MIMINSSEKNWFTFNPTSPGGPTGPCVPWIPGFPGNPKKKLNYCFIIIL